MFQALDISYSGTRLARTWLDSIADNVANVNTIRPADAEPFRARQIIAAAKSEVEGRGVRVARIPTTDEDPILVYDPAHPFADENGNVKQAVVDLSVEMTNLLLANRTYQANLSVFDRATESYRAAIQIASGR